MWQPRAFGIFAGWLMVACAAVYFLSDEMIKAGLFGEACRTYGLGSWSCGVLPKAIVALPNSLAYFLELPFTAGGNWYMLGTDYILMFVGSPLAYLFAIAAANYWIWKLNSL